jgi:hypothetical protein
VAALARWMPPSLSLRVAMEYFHQPQPAAQSPREIGVEGHDCE